MPTVSDLVEFDAEQTINGISFSTYSANSSLYDTTLKETIAETMTGVNPGDIQDFTAAAAPARRLLQSYTTSVRMNGRTLSSDALATSYKVSVRNASLSYDELSTELTDAVESGEFDTLLTTNAQDNGATALVGATSDEVETQNLVTDSGSSDDGLSGGAIAGIVIGVLVGVALICGAIYYVISNKDTSEAQVKLTSSEARDLRSSL